MLVYIEYVSRLQGVTIEDFHSAVQHQDEWSNEYGDDRLVLNIGRTFRLGPEPSYLAVWYTPNAGVERLGEWERIFAAGEADDLQERFARGARIEKAGCYDPLLDPVHTRGGLYYAEYFDLAPGATRDDVRACYERRREEHEGIDLVLLCDRIGRLGPDPRGLAIWDLHEWTRLDRVARELHGATGPVRLVAAALYRDVGHETL